MRSPSLLVDLALFTGCSSEATKATSPLPPEPTSCSSLELALPGGSCTRPGVLPDGCADGFEHDSARAGLASFGANVTLAGVHVRCAAFTLAGENHFDRAAEVNDQGGNLCGCPAADSACTLVSANLVPPDAQDVGR